MQLSQNELLFLYLFVVICVLVSFIAIRKKPRDPVRLRLARENRAPAPKVASQAAKLRSQDPSKAARAPHNTDSRSEKTLNAFFEHRGRRYDAYEVLGLPAGASVPSAQSAFNAQFLSAEGENRVLLKAALEAIRITRT